jgi:hypothetical protein
MQYGDSTEITFGKQFPTFEAMSREAGLASTVKITFIKG